MTVDCTLLRVRVVSPYTQFMRKTFKGDHDYIGLRYTTQSRASPISILKGSASSKWSTKIALYDIYSGHRMRTDSFDSSCNSSVREIRMTPVRTSDPHALLTGIINLLLEGQSPMREMIENGVKLGACKIDRFLRRYDVDETGTTTLTYDDITETEFMGDSRLLELVFAALGKMMCDVKTRHYAESFMRIGGSTEEPDESYRGETVILQCIRPVRFHLSCECSDVSILTTNTLVQLVVYLETLTLTESRFNSLYNVVAKELSKRV